MTKKQLIKLICDGRCGNEIIVEAHEKDRITSTRKDDEGLGWLSHNLDLCPACFKDVFLEYVDYHDVEII